MLRKMWVKNKRQKTKDSRLESSRKKSQLVTTTAPIRSSPFVNTYSRKKFINRMTSCSSLIIAFLPHDIENYIEFINKGSVISYEQEERKKPKNIEFLRYCCNIRSIRVYNLSYIPKNLLWRKLRYISLGNYNGSLDNLKNIKITVLDLPDFTGDLSCLESCDIEDLYIPCYSKPVKTLEKFQKLNKLEIASKDLEGIEKLPNLKYLFLRAVDIPNGQSKYISKLSLKMLQMTDKSIPMNTRLIVNYVGDSYIFDQ